ncbi:hypothetical protein [Paraburkholderia fungorum]|uniref:hypothetical protein n=1 Tax=Paraburkholderia fungorum TaxID=134537 RepID=UPI0038BBDFDC
MKKRDAAKWRGTHPGRAKLRGLQQTLALLKILAFGQKDLEQRKFKGADEFLAELYDLDRKAQIR